MDANMKLSHEDGELLPDASCYGSLIGRLLYFTITRPDLAYAVYKLSQYVSLPQVPHMEAATNVLIYIKGTAGQGIFYSSESNTTLSLFFDAD